LVQGGSPAGRRSHELRTSPALLLLSGWRSLWSLADSRDRGVVLVVVARRGEDDDEVVVQPEEGVMESVLLDAAGRPRSPATTPGFHAGRPPRNKGLRYPPDPPSVEEIVAVMRSAGDGAEGVRLRALIVILWRAGLRISEALALAESDLDAIRGAVLVRRGKGGRRREVGMDRWGWEQLRPWLELRATLPVGASLCVLHGRTAGRPWAASAAREELRVAAVRAGVRRRFAPHQLRHAHAVEMAREGIPITVIQRQLGHADLGVTSVYLRGIDNTEIIDTVHERRAPMMSANAGLRIDPQRPASPETS
jgi:integrase